MTKLALRAAVTLAAFAWLISLIDLQRLGDTLRQTDPKGLLLATALYLVAFVTCSVRWKVLVDPIYALPFQKLFRWFLIGAFFNTLLPTTIGGDVIRIREAGRVIGNWSQAAATVFLDRLTGFTAMFAIGALATLAILPRLQQHPIILQGVAGMLLIFLLVLAGLFHEGLFLKIIAPLKWLRLHRIETFTRECRELLIAYGKHPKAVVTAFALSLCVQTLAMGIFWVVARAMHLQVPLWSILVFAPILMTIAMLPISLNGLGVREGAAVILFGSVGLPAAEALGLSLINGLIPAISGIWGAWAWITYRYKTEKK